MAQQPDPTFLDHLIATLAGTWPEGSAEERRRAALAALEALQPHDIVEAMLAARMIAAHHATMDGFRRAMQPGVNDADAVRLRNNAIAATRSFDAALRTLGKRQGAAGKPSQPDRQAAKVQHARTMPPEPCDVPPDTETPTVRRRQFVPRNKNGEAIPLWRYEDMTMAQRRATYGDPDDAELQAIARAEEDAMIEAEGGGGVTAAPNVLESR
jgi:hypothetical protein